MGVDFYRYATEIVGQVPAGSTWLYDVVAILLIVFVLAIFVGIPLFFIYSIVNR